MGAGAFSEEDTLVATSKIHQAMTRLGFSFMDAIVLVRYDISAETAYWSYDAETAEEHICVGPIIAAMDISSIEMVLRHEFLHRSTYHGFNERFADRQMLNIVQDVCINRLLYEAYPEKMEKLSLQVYPAEAKKTVIALADCTADPRMLCPELGQLWRYIWEKNDQGNFASLNPSALYYRLVELRALLMLEIPASLSLVFAEHKPFPSGTASSMDRALGEILKGIGDNLPGISDAGAMMNTYLSTEYHFNGDKVVSFFESLAVDRLFSETRTDLAEIVRELSYDPYILRPSRREITFMSLGYSGMLGYYHNIHTDIKPVRLKIIFYVDVSGSMEGYFAVVHHFLKAVFNVPLGIRIFDTSVREIPVEDYISGRFRVGGGTSFDRVVENLVADADVGAGVIFTDGQGSVEPVLQQQFRRSGKQLDVVYFVEPGTTMVQSPLDSLTTRKLVMPVRKAMRCDV